MNVPFCFYHPTPLVILYPLQTPPLATSPKERHLVEKKVASLSVVETRTVIPTAIAPLETTWLQSIHECFVITQSRGTPFYIPYSYSPETFLSHRSFLKFLFLDFNTAMNIYKVCPKFTQPLIYAAISYTPLQSSSVLKYGVVGNTLFIEFHIGGKKVGGGLIQEITLFGVYLFIHLFIHSNIFILCLS